MKDNALTRADINEATLGTVPTASSASTAAVAATANSVAPNAIGAAQVADGSLSTRDVALASGVETIDVPELDANTCFSSGVYAGVDVENDIVYVVPDDSFNPHLTVSADVENAADSVGINVCNFEPVDNVDPPADEFFWVVFNMP